MIDRPIFIIGAGRSGSTVVHDILAGHPQVARLSAFGLQDLNRCQALCGAKPA